MKRRIFKFWVIFALAAGCFFFQSCTTPNFLWCTSSGIVTYNRHTGQFEMLWENQAQHVETIHDTIYVYTQKESEKPSSKLIEDR